MRNNKHRAENLSAGYFHTVRFTIACSANLGMSQSLLILTMCLIASISATCPGKSIDEPIEFEDGEYLIAAIFHMGKFVPTSSDNQTYPDGYCTDDEKSSFWALQRALAFRKAMQAERARLR